MHAPLLPTCHAAGKSPLWALSGCNTRRAWSWAECFPGRSQTTTEAVLILFLGDVEQSDSRGLVVHPVSSDAAPLPLRCLRLSDLRVSGGYEQGGDWGSEERPGVDRGKGTLQEVVARLPAKAWELGLGVRCRAFLPFSGRLPPVHNGAPKDVSTCAQVHEVVHEAVWDAPPVPASVPGARWVLLLNIIIITLKAIFFFPLSSFFPLWSLVICPANFQL